MSKKPKICTNCFETFDFRAIKDHNLENSVFCSYKCRNAFSKREIIELGPTEWQKLVKIINAK